MTIQQIQDAEQQIYEQRRTVRFDIRELTIGNYSAPPA